MKKLPIGIQDFRKLRENDYLYVDKTESIYKLLQGSCYFLSRPRRFGKSLLISTLKEIFSGSRELFEGLWIYDKIEWNNFPVIHIDFSSIDYKTLGLQKALLEYFRCASIEYNIKLEANSNKGKLQELITRLSDRGKVVLLIDEYDKPIIDFITDRTQSTENREILKNFYSALKPMDAHLKFLFITGVSKFSKVSIFSDLNNLNDITINGNCSDIAGYTEQEIHKYFDTPIIALAKKLKYGKKKTLIEIKRWYNGYSWNGNTFVYNPFSILKLFYTLEFANYWFATGTPTFLVQYIRESQKPAFEFEQKTVSDLFFDKFELENLDIFSLLFQTGYITIKNSEKKTGKYTLAYPNHEVRNSFIHAMLEGYVHQVTSDTSEAIWKIRDALNMFNLELLIASLKSLFASIPHDIFIKDREAYYHSVIYLVLNLLGFDIQSEVHTNKGSIDAIIKTADRIYILEFKLGKAETAMDQIKNKRYFERYLSDQKKITLLGIGFSTDNRNIDSWLVEEIEG